ncbi:PKD domain-containing protein [Croceimicrobium hydrocarbonivorans]|uniref:PKD domain-containing protein n=1 Tax=Croceimicrobium hydrocarbonivorans TaxID=2761580 RepID=A0A7H0VA43_9FLAO|nr:PKD domain-containing protein [Croceimicrobium hydrocarbonivorans]QNR22591.1 PKD domain-containing protein [Croceimicrobium hydrocarbonivorans]
MNVKSIFSKTSLWISMGLLVVASACKEDDKPTLGQPPSQADAAFTYQASASSDNIIEFTAANSSLAASWDFGNGSTGSGSNVSATYPFAGSYDVTLTVQNSGGSASSTQTIVIAQDDPSLINNPLFALLTGGSSKTWAVDSASPAHFGVGPDPIGAAGRYPEWYAAQANEKAGADMYNDRYTFHLNGFGFDQVTGGGVYVNAEHAGIAPFDDTTASPVADYIAAFPDQMGETWTLNDSGSDTTLTVSGDAMIGYWAGTRTYTVISLEENELWLSFVDTKASNPALTWYIRLVPEGYNSNPNPAEDPDLPLDFESVEPTWTTFGNGGYQYIANPDMSGINTSSKVMEVTHGNETWAGQYVNLKNNLDFSAQNMIKLNVWASDTGTFRLKLEDKTNSNNFVEVDAHITQTNSWEELSFDFTGVASDFGRLVIFPGWGITTADVFYVDDIKQE